MRRSCLVLLGTRQHLDDGSRLSLPGALRLRRQSQGGQGRYTTLKCTGGATVSTSQWAVKAYWYEAESDDVNHRSYKICPGGVVDLPLNCLVQASDLEFHRNMRYEAGGVRGVLTVQSHLSIVAHNLDNYK